MSTSSAPGSMASEEIVRLSRAHTFFSWSAQGAIDPIAIDHAIGPNVIAALTSGMTEFLERNADRGWRSLADFRGLRRGTVVPHSQIARPADAGYHGGYADEAEGYAEPVAE